MWCVCVCQESRFELKELMETVQRRLNDNSFNTCYVKCLEVIRILSRDKNGLDLWVSEDLMNSLVRLAQLDDVNLCVPITQPDSKRLFDNCYRYLQYFIVTHDAVEKTICCIKMCGQCCSIYVFLVCLEALKCLCNLNFNSEKGRHLTR